MSSLITQPQLIATAATDLAEVNSVIDAAKAAAAGPTTGLVAAAQDEVSAAVAALFGGYGKEYHALLKQAAAFHGEFAAALAGAGGTYAQAEVANASALLEDPAGVITLVLGASGYPIPSPEYIEGIPPLYIDRWYPPGVNVGVNTPEGLYPLTGVNSLPFNTSVSQGLTILDNAIHSAIANGNTTINVFGYSQSAAIVSLEMHALNPTNTLGGSLLPNGVNLNITLVGDVANPNGGVLARFPGLSLTSLGFTFGTATPDNSFPTRIYTIEYDGFADFPQYPIDVFSDVNAFLGIIELHGGYPFLTPLEINGATQLTTVGPTQTQYYIVDTGKFPLTDFIRDIPVVGNPIADLVEPDLKVLVNLGYGSTDVGYSQTPANIPTPFGVLPPVPANEIISALAAGTHQGVSAFSLDLQNLMTSPPHVLASHLTSTIDTIGTHLSTGTHLVGSALSSPENFLAALQAATTRFSYAISGAASAAYGTLLPTADIVNSLLTTIPAYDVDLFLDGVQQMFDGDITGGLVYALGAPMAADTALLTLFGGFELRVLEHAATQIIGDFKGTTPAPPQTATI
jgi:hypothetical protein